METKFEDIIPKLMMGGIDLFKNKLMVDYYTETIERTWKERLFSLPFHPFKRTRKITKTKPKTTIMWNKKDNWIMGHPSVIEKIKDSLKDIPKDKIELSDFKPPWNIDISIKSAQEVRGIIDTTAP